MLSVTITEKDGPSTTTTFDKTEVLIGRVKGNDIVLPKTNVSKRHSRIVIKDGKIILIDLKSTNGTFVNGRKITSPQVMQDGDKIYIGDFTIEVREIPGGTAQPMPSAAAPSPMGNFSPVPSASSLPGVGGMPMEGHNGLGGPQHGPGLAGPGIGGPSLGGPSLGGPSLGGPGLSGTNFPRPNLGGPNGPSLPNSPASTLPGGAATTVPSAPGVMPPHGGMDPNISLAGPGQMAGPGSMTPSPAPSLGIGMGPGLSPASPLPPGPGLGGLEQPANLPGPSPLPAASPLPGAPSLGASPSLSSGPQSSPLSSPSGARQQPGPSIGKPSSLGLAPASDSLNDSKEKSRLPGVTSQPLSVSKHAGNRSDKSFGTAALPEDIIISDARTPDSDSLMAAARVVMDNYLSKNDFQNILAQAYPPTPEIQDACYNDLMTCINECHSAIGNVDVNVLSDMLLKEACGLGAVDSLIDDVDVSSFIVYNFETIVAERKGRREISNLQFTSADTLYLVTQRLLSFQGINTQAPPPVSEIRFGDGTQLQVLMPPVSVSSSMIVVRKIAHEFKPLQTLVDEEVLSAEMAKFLSLCVKARRNILIAGAQGSGRTTILNALGAEISDGERILTVENTAMLMMPQMFVMNLEAQNAAFGQGGDLASLIRQSSKLRAERVIVDAIQSAGDASAFLSAICAGAQGSIATCNALTSQEGFDSFKRMISSDSANAALAGNIDIVITVRAFTDARRRIVDISEVAEDDNGLVLNQLYGWQASGMGNMARGNGQFKATGNVPKFYRELERGGMQSDPTLFN